MAIEKKRGKHTKPATQGESPSSSRDINKRRQAADDLARVNQQLEDLSRFPRENPHPVFRVDGDGSILFANAACSKLDFKCQPGQILPDRYRLIVAEVLGNGRHRIVEVASKERLFALNFVPIPNAGYVNIYGSDITERKQAEEALRKAYDELEMRVQERTKELKKANRLLQTERQRFNDVLETLPAYLVLLTPDYHVPFANRFFRERFGESHGRRCFEYLFGRTEPCEVCETYKVLENRKPLEWEWNGPDGQNYYVYDFPFTDADGATLILEVGLDITKQKQAEEALRKAHDELEMRVQERTRELGESQNDLNRAQAVAQTGSWRLDVKRNELLWSEETYRIFGIPGGTPMTYGTFLSCVHPEDQEYLDNQWQAALQGKGYDVEHRIVVGDKVKWVRERAELECDERGMLKGGFGTVQDITDRVLAEEAIKQAARQWQETFDAIPDLISIHDRDYNIVKVNQAFARAFGMTTEQLVGKKCYEVFHRSNKPILGCPHQQTIKTGQAMSEEIFEPTRDAYFDVSTATIVDASGEITSSVHIARDITQRKKTEEKIAFQARLLDGIEDSVLAADTERRITYWNKGAEGSLGWKAEEVMGRDAVAFLLPEGSGQEAEAIEEQLRSGRSWSGEIDVRRRDGALVPLLAQSSPVLDQDGKFSGVIAVGKDIAELKKIDKIKDEFIGLVSHELRTPLTIITGSLQSAMSPGISPEEAYELIQNAAEGADSLAVILENMLELSRYQAGRLHLNVGPVAISEVAQGVIRRLTGQGARQRFSLDFADDLPQVEADPMRVERILYNLVENATKYSPEESEIKVSGRKEGDLIVTGVTDQGQGISRDDQDKLFEPFERLETPSHSKGVGLGLVVCKRLVEAQGGWLKVDSAPGKGSTFSFALPIRGTKV